MTTVKKKLENLTFEYFFFLKTFFNVSNTIFVSLKFPFGNFIIFEFPESNERVKRIKKI